MTLLSLILAIPVGLLVVYALFGMKTSSWEVETWEDVAEDEALMGLEPMHSPGADLPNQTFTQTVTSDAWNKMKQSDRGTEIPLDNERVGVRPEAVVSGMESMHIVADGLYPRWAPNVEAVPLPGLPPARPKPVHAKPLESLESMASKLPSQLDTIEAIHHSLCRKSCDGFYQIREGFSCKCGVISSLFTQKTRKVQVPVGI